MAAIWNGGVLLCFWSVVFVPKLGRVARNAKAAAPYESELLVTKMLDMPISEMKKFLKETLLESTTSTNREEGEALLQSLEGLLENADGDIQIPNGDKSILETATVKGLQEALDTDGNVDENYLKDLKDVSDLKIIGDEMGWDFSGFDRRALP